MNELNLIPYSIKIKKQKVYQIRQYIAWCLLVLCIMFAGAYFPSVKLSELREEERMLLNKVNESKAALEASKLFSSELASYNERLQLIDYLTKNKVVVSDRISDIEKYIPRDIQLVSINSTAEGLAIVGTTNNYKAISEFGANLQTSKKYKSAKISAITGGGTNGAYSFTLNIKY